MTDATPTPPQGCARISLDNGKLTVPDQPVIPYIRGGGAGPVIWLATVKVLEAAVDAAYGGTRKIHCMGINAGQKGYGLHNRWLPDAAVDACRESLVSIKGPLTT